MAIFEIPPKLKILSFLILREVTDLNEVGNHGLSILLLLRRSSFAIQVAEVQSAQFRSRRQPGERSTGSG
jgi:hypothetical protein